MHRYLSGTQLELEFSCSVLQAVCHCSNPRTFFFFLSKVKDKINIRISEFGGRKQKPLQLFQTGKLVFIKQESRLWAGSTDMASAYPAGLSFKQADPSSPVRRWRWHRTSEFQNTNPELGVWGLPLLELFLQKREASGCTHTPRTRLHKSTWLSDNLTTVPNLRKAGPCHSPVFKY